MLQKQRITEIKSSPDAMHKVGLSPKSLLIFFGVELTLAGVLIMLNALSGPVLILTGAALLGALWLNENKWVRRRLTVIPGKKERVGLADAAKETYERTRNTKTAEMRVDLADSSEDMLIYLYCELLIDRLDVALYGETNWGTVLIPPDLPFELVIRKGHPTVRDKNDTLVYADLFVGRADLDGAIEQILRSDKRGAVPL